MMTTKTMILTVAVTKMAVVLPLLLFALMSIAVDRLLSPFRRDDSWLADAMARAAQEEDRITNQQIEEPSLSLFPHPFFVNREPQANTRLAHSDPAVLGQ